jgi:hypothetical protein
LVVMWRSSITKPVTLRKPRNWIDLLLGVVNKLLLGRSCLGLGIKASDPGCLAVEHRLDFRQNSRLIDGGHIERLKL